MINKIQRLSNYKWGDDLQSEEYFSDEFVLIGKGNWDWMNLLTKSLGQMFLTFGELRTEWVHINSYVCSKGVHVKYVYIFKIYIYTYMYINLKELHAHD